MDTDLMKRKATAFHEAGHAIIAAVKGIEVSEVSIITHENLQGECEVDHDGYLMNNLDRLRTAIFELLTYATAGGVAQEMYYKMSGREFSVESMRQSTAYDDDYVEEMNNRLVSNGDDPIDLIAVREDIVKSFENTEIWNATANLAEDLLSNNKLEGDALFQHLKPFIPGGAWGGAAV